MKLNVTSFLKFSAFAIDEQKKMAREGVLTQDPLRL